jgi:signal transduction histidine kinase
MSLLSRRWPGGTESLSDVSASGIPNVQGYGLGLPLLHQIAESHGGSVAILPRVEARSSVRVTLPVREAD